MESKVEELKKVLEFTRGELSAVKYLVATLIGAGIKSEAFFEKVLPELSRLIETDRQEGQQSSAYLAGMEHVHKIFSSAPPY